MEIVFTLEYLVDPSFHPPIAMINFKSLFNSLSFINLPILSKIKYKYYIIYAYKN